MTARVIARVMARIESRIRAIDWEDLAGRVVTWTDRLFDSPALAKTIWGFLLFASGYFLGVFVNFLNG